MVPDLVCTSDAPGNLPNAYFGEQAVIILSFSEEFLKIAQLV